MFTKFTACVALAAGLALAGCATTGTSVFATTKPLVTDTGAQTVMAPPMTNGDSGNRYRVFPGDTNTKGS